MTGIYKITSPTGRVYIGQSWDINKRKSSYRYSHGTRFQVHLYNSILKYGWINHIFEVVHELPSDITQEVLDQYEVLYWEAYKELGFKMMNIKHPGSGGKHAKETIVKMKEKRKLQVYSEESKQKMSQSAKQKDLSIAINNVSKFQQKGSGNPRATLTEAQVIEIKQRLSNGDRRRDIVKDYNTTKGIIDNIALGRSWSHIKI